MPLISVLMPVYNVEAFVGQAIESILKQTFTQFELLIIDDCSTDRTVDMVEKFKDERIVLIKKPQNTGLVASLNIGLERACGEFIARMDGDDISNELRLEKQLAYMQQHSDVDICGSAYRSIGSDREVYFPATHDEIKFYMLDFCPMGHPSVFMRKSFITGHQLRYDASFTGAEDYELWTRCVWLGKMANLTDILLWYREHPHQVSKTIKPLQVANSDICRVNMLRRLWENASLTDLYTREFLFRDATLNNIEELNTIVKWMDNIVETNKEGNYYAPQLFDGYVRTKKKGVIRRFFLTVPAYTPKLFLKQIKAQNNYRQYFTSVEYVKLALKCMFFWRLKFATT
ncbi:glycosyltransferase family 2 protein [Mucilaginibacter sp. HD30]